MFPTGNCVCTIAYISRRICSPCFICNYIFTYGIVVGECKKLVPVVNFVVKCNNYNDNGVCYSIIKEDDSIPKISVLDRDYMKYKTIVDLINNTRTTVSVLSTTKDVCANIVLYNK